MFKAIFFLMALVGAVNACANTSQHGPFYEFDHTYLDPTKESFYFQADDGMFQQGSLWASSFRPEHTVTTPYLNEDIDTWEGTTIILADFGTSFLTHYFHFLEHLLGFWEFGGCANRELVTHILYCSSEHKDVDYNWKGVNAISEKILQALFPHAKVQTLKQVKDSTTKPIYIPQLIFSSRIVSLHEPEARRLNKMLGSVWDQISVEKMEELKKILFSFYNIPVKDPDSQLRITYLKRPSPRKLTSRKEHGLLGAIDRLDGNLTITDLALIPYEEQLKIIANTDILISVHGNGLSHIPFLPDHATVIEIFPKDSYMWDYCMFSRISRVDYWGTYGIDRWVTEDIAFTFSPFGNVFKEVKECDSPEILHIVKQKIDKFSSSRDQFLRRTAI